MQKRTENAKRSLFFFVFGRGQPRTSVPTISFFYSTAKIFANYSQKFSKSYLFFGDFVI